VARVKPFRAIRPNPGNVSRVVSHSLDLYSKKEVSNILDSNPDSFLNVIRPEYQQEQKSPPNSEQLFEKSRVVYEKMLARGVFQKDETEGYYIYTQHIGKASYTGIIGCASVEDYNSGVIRIHEQTIASREKVLRDYLSVCQINAEPVCFTYPRTGSLELLVEIVRQDLPLLDFEDDDGRKHQLWKVDDAVWTGKFSEKLANLKHIYIADGHHRSASSVLFAHDKWRQSQKVSGTEPYNYFLSIFFPDDQLKIYEFNRIVKGLGNKGTTQFLQELEADFEVNLHGAMAVKPQRVGDFGMYLDGKWYKLIYRHRRSSEVVAGLDVSILSSKILTPLLNINDLRNNNQIGFVPGTKGSQELERLVNSGKYDVAFQLYPVTGKDFYTIADQGKTMPPKSTYIVPKLLSGLLIYSLEQG